LGLSPIQLEAYSLRPFGGRQQIYYNLEFQFPLIEEAKINGVVFYDVGYADDSISWDELRSNTGFGFRWFSPIGPLRFEWGFPIDRDTLYNEDSMQFNFAIGSPF
jgi:outer membrane protein insertion porin family